MVVAIPDESSAPTRNGALLAAWIQRRSRHHPRRQHLRRVATGHWHRATTEILTLGHANNGGIEADVVRELPSEPVAGGSGLCRAGDGTPYTLFVHGGYHGTWCFGGRMRGLSASGIASAAPNPRRHGFLVAEDLHPETCIADHAATLVGAATRLSGELTLVGHSLGA